MKNICDLSHKELVASKKTMYDAILEDGHMITYKVLKEMLDKLCEIEKELTLRRR